MIKEFKSEGIKKVADVCERYIHGLFNYKVFPRKHWVRIRTTNMMERANKEIKRQSRVVGAFPSEGSLLRLVGAILIDINEGWLLGSRYLDMDE